MTGSSLRSRASWVKLRPNWSRIWLLPLSLAGSSLVDPPTLAPAVPDEDALAAPGRALVAGQELDDLLADAGEVGAELDEDLGGDALALADQAEQDVLGADVVVAELQGLAQRELEHLLGPRRERDVAGRRGAALADDLLDLAAHGLERDAQALEGLGGDALALVDQPEQDVLGADVRVVEQACFLLGEDDDPAGPIGESSRTCAPFPAWADVRPVYRCALAGCWDGQLTPGAPRPPSGYAFAARKVPDRGLYRWPRSLRSSACLAAAGAATLDLTIHARCGRGPKRSLPDGVARWLAGVPLRLAPTLD